MNRVKGDGYFNKMMDETYYYMDLYNKVNKDLTYFKPVKHVK